MQRTRTDHLKPHTAQIENVEGPVRINTRYGAQWNEVDKIHPNHWHLLTRSKDLKAIVGPRPFLVAKQARNLNDTLVKSEYLRTPNRNWLTDLSNLKGMHPCDHSGMCRYVDCSMVFTDISKNYWI